MKRLYIIKLGTTFPDTLQRLGDFDRWTTIALGPLETPVEVVDATRVVELPAPHACAGVVITGSHAMVTDNLPWSVHVERWIPALLEAAVPIFGVCYGHQLLARAAGGEAGYHPRGQEIGTVEVERLPAAAQDPLFRDLPERFAAHTTHSQTVLRLPSEAVHLARNAFEPHHAFRVGPSAWGVQFHPEYTVEIMRAYIEEQTAGITAAGQDVPALLNGVRDTTLAAQTIRNFGRLVDQRLTGRIAQAV